MRPDQWEHGLLRHATSAIVILGLLFSTLVQTTSATPATVAEPLGPLDVVKVEGMETSGGWKYDIVHKGKVGNFPLMVLDSRGNPHVVFIYGHPGNVVYAWKNGTSWGYETVITDYWIEDVALAIGPDDSPHIVYTELADRFMYAHKRNGTWETELIVWGLGGYSQGLRPCIAVDSQNRPYVGQFEGNSQVLKDIYFRLSYRGPDGWYNSSKFIYFIVEMRFDNLKYFGCSIVIDSNDLPHIAFFSKDSIVYGHWNGSWTFDVLQPEPLWNGYYGRPWLTLDSQDRPHVSYVVDYEKPPRGVVRALYATKGLAGWSFEVFEWMTPLTYISVAIDASDVAHILYKNQWRNLTLARFDGGWKYENLDTTPGLSSIHRLTLIIDDRNNIGALYVINDQDFSTYELRFGYKRKLIFIAERRSVGDGERTFNRRDDVTTQLTCTHPPPRDSWDSSIFARDRSIVNKIQAITVKSRRSLPIAWTGDVS